MNNEEPVQRPLEHPVGRWQIVEDGRKWAVILWREGKAGLVLCECADEESAARIVAVHQENERLREDAARYRFLRDSENWPAVFGTSSAPEPLRGWLLDEAVRLGMTYGIKTPNAALSGCRSRDGSE